MKTKLRETKKFSKTDYKVALKRVGIYYFKRRLFNILAVSLYCAPHGVKISHIKRTGVYLIRVWNVYHSKTAQLL